MSLEKKYLIILGVIFVLAGIAGLCWWLIRSPEAEKINQKPAASSTPYTSQSLNVADNTNSISLTNPPPRSDYSGGFSLTPNAASNDISLNGNGSSRNGSSSAEAMLDPKTFGQYDKHKDGQGALFAELLAGEGAELTEGKRAAVYYKGWLTDGRLFDMSRAGADGKLEPFIFTLGARQVIPGWEQALAGMKAGGVRFLIIPPAVGYGAQGQDPIPGKAVLIFQVQLLAVE